MVINEILQDSNYKLDLFSEESIKYLENKIINKVNNDFKSEW